MVKQRLHFGYIYTIIKPLLSGNDKTVGLRFFGEKEENQQSVRKKTHKSPGLKHIFHPVKVGSEFGWCTPLFLPEDAVKVGDVVKPAFVANLRNTFAGLYQHACGRAQAYLVYEVHE